MDREAHFNNPSDHGYGPMPGHNEGFDFFHSHESSCGDPILNSFEFTLHSPPLFPHVDSSIAPSALQVSHNSHDDSCVDQCPGSLGSQGLTKYPPPPSRMRLTPASVCPSLPQVSGFQQWTPSFGAQARPFNHHGSYSNRFVAQSLTNGTGFEMPQRQIPIAFVDPRQQNYASQDGSECCSTVDCCTDPECEKNICEGDDCPNPSDNTTCLTSPAHNEESFWMNEPVNDFRHFSYGNISNGNNWTVPQSTGHALAPHDPNCNHTQTEHETAATLQGLRQDFATIRSPSIVYHGDADPISAVETPALTAETATASPMSHRASISLPEPQGVNTCRWLVGDVHKRICGQEFSSVGDLHQHVASEHVVNCGAEKVCRWEDCTRELNKKFMSKNKLQRHMTTHTGYKPFTCEICNDSFSAQQALDQHRRIHTGDKPYACEVPGCGKAFKQKSALTMHKRVHTGEKPLQCEVCGRTFGESSNLSKHRRIHQQEYKYQCPDCPKSFRRFDQMRRHQQKHERERNKASNEGGQILNLSNVDDGVLADALQQANALEASEANEGDFYNMLHDFA